MKYYELYLGVADEAYSDNFSYKEIDKERFHNLKKRFKDTANYRFAEQSVSDEYNITWDFQLNYNKGYVSAIATDEDFEQIKKIMFQKVYDFVKDTIEYKTKQIEKLTAEVKILSEHPIYDAITKSNMREEKINQILN